VQRTQERAHVFDVILNVAAEGIMIEQGRGSRFLQIIGSCVDFPETAHEEIAAVENFRRVVAIGRDREEADGI